MKRLTENIYLQPKEKKSLAERLLSDRFLDATFELRIKNDVNSCVKGFLKWSAFFYFVDNLGGTTVTFVLVP